MEKIMSNLHMERVKCSKQMQFVIEEDKNISDQSPDIIKILMEDGELVIEEVRPGKDFADVRGKLKYHILYLTDESERRLHRLSGEILWEEKIRAEGLETYDTVRIKDCIEDMRSSCINSRKINIRALVQLGIFVKEDYDEEVITRLDGEEIEQKKESFPYSEVQIDRKDILRIKEEMELPPAFPGIDQVLWKSLELNKWEVKPLEDHISIQAEIAVVLLYRSSGPESLIKTYETMVKYSGNMECPGSNAHLSESILPVIRSKQINVKQDEDGEDRVLEAEMVMELYVRLWEEKETELITDVYGIQRQLLPVYREGNYCRRKEKQLLRLKLGKTVRIPASSPKILQICCTKIGNISLEQEKTEEKIYLQGSIPFQILYLTENQEEYGGCKEEIKFRQELEAEDGSTMYEVWGMVQQWKTILLDGEEAEVKVTLLLEAAPVYHGKKQYLCEIEKEETEGIKRNRQPSMAVYRTSGKEDLWEIGKKFGIPVEAIKSVNQLEGETMPEGQRLLLVR